MALIRFTSQCFKSVNRCFILRRGISTSKYQYAQSCVTSVQQLHEIKQDPAWHEKYRILDARWDVPVADYSIEHFASRIPGSKYFGLEDCRDKESPYLMMLPSVEQFEDYVSDLGVTNAHHVIVYDAHPLWALFSSPRLWWMFRVFGHENVSVLDGGMRRWIQDGYEVCSGDYGEGEQLPKPAEKFKATYTPALVRHFEDMLENTKSADPITMIEARPTSMMEMQPHETDITGKAVPGSIWCPFPFIMDNENPSIHSKEAILKYFADKGVDLDQDVIATCKRGLTASILSHLIYHARGKDVPVYDGSMTEWSDRVAKE